MSNQNKLVSQSSQPPNSSETKDLQNLAKELGLKPHDHLNSNLVVRAVNALLKHEENKRKLKKKEQLFEVDDIISLIITLNKVPQKPRIRPYRIHLPYPLWNDECEICVFVKDPEKEWKKLFEQIGITNVKKVIGLAKMRAKYNTFEARRKLLGSYDLFLCDENITLMLRRFLGRQFFQSKKYPIPIRITRNSLADKIRKAKHSTYLYLKTGTCLNVRIARVNFTTKQICVNILRTINDIVNHIPGKWKNVKSILIKTPSSIALPIYNQLPPQNLRIKNSNQNQQENNEKTLRNKKMKK